jgi:hypothetical protein
MLYLLRERVAFSPLADDGHGCGWWHRRKQRSAKPRAKSSKQCDHQQMPADRTAQAAPDSVPSVPSRAYGAPCDDVAPVLNEAMRCVFASHCATHNGILGAVRPDRQTATVAGFSARSLRSAENKRVVGKPVDCGPWPLQNTTLEWRNRQLLPAALERTLSRFEETSAASSRASAVTVSPEQSVREEDPQIGVRGVTLTLKIEEALARDVIPSERSDIGGW